MAKEYIPTERDVTVQIVDYLRLKGAYVIKAHGHLGQRPGVPDLLACWQGRFIAIEVKSPRYPRRGLSEKQWEEMGAIFAAGGVTIVARRLEDVMEVVT